MPEIARKTWRTLEPYHGAIYFVPEATEEYRRVGVEDRMAGYFASRASAMGAVGAEVVIATFFNFDHDLVRRSMAGVWNTTSPAVLQVARLAAADRMIRRLAPGAIDDPDVVEAASLIRVAADAAGERPEGRPLFAGHASLTWPTEPHMALWHAQTLLREFRGDGHIAALTLAGLTGCEALVTHAAAGDVSAEVLKGTRQRTDDDWQAARESLQRRGWLDVDGSATAAGRRGRSEVERHTDELAAAPYAALGPEGCARLRELVRPISKQMATAFG